MNFLELAEKRYSVRDYADKNVEEEKLKKILAAAHAAPTAANLQPVRLLVLQTKEQLAKLEKSANLHDHLATRLSLDELVLKIF